jgi:hypothetical protein
MNRAIALLLFVGTTGLLFSPLAAADKHLSRRDKVSAETDMANFSSCVVSLNRPDLVAYLRLSPYSKKYNHAGQNLATEMCLSISAGSMRFKPDLFRWSLFEALYKADFGKQPIEDVSSTPPIDFRNERDWAAGDDIGYINQYVAVRDFGDCTSRKNAALVDAVLNSKVYSSEEQALFEQLQPELGKCLAGSGKLTFTRTSLRGILAEALYNLRMKLRSTAPAAPISGANS